MNVTILISYINYLHLYFSSLVPRVKSTNPQTRSLKTIPFIVPPQAEYIYYKIFHYNGYKISITMILITYFCN